MEEIELLTIYKTILREIKTWHEDLILLKKFFTFVNDPNNKTQNLFAIPLPFKLLVVYL